jgi:Protein of unknown function (DUF642)
MRTISLACAAALALAGCSSIGEQPLVPGLRAMTTTGYCPANPSGTGILPDGDFSEAIEPDGDEVVKKHRSFAPYWEVTKGNIDFLSPTYWDMDHLCSVDIDGYFTIGAIATSAFTTVKKATYTATFLMSGNGACGPTIKTLLVTANDKSETFTWNTASGNDVQHADYSLESWTFKAKSTMTQLGFTSEDPKGSSCGAVIAGVAVNRGSP